MERYGGSGLEPLSSDPPPGRIGPEMEAGLEEGTWRLRLEGANSYPERPNEADCIHFLRTGFCVYGAKCRFNHPTEGDSVIGAVRTGTADYPERAGQPICQYYMRTGTCKFGASCKFDHPKQGAVSAAPVYYGYPLRPGEKECSYYMRTGKCKFGAACKFHHPQPPDIPVSTPFPVQRPAAVPAPFVGPVLCPLQQPSVHSSQQCGVIVAGPSLLPSYVLDPYSPVLVSPGMVHYPGWSHYQATVSPSASPPAQPTTWSSSLYGTAQVPSSISSFRGLYQPPLPSLAASSGSEKEKSYPQRTGQRDCQHYMKTGDCKFGSSCRYHHPRDLTVQGTSIVLSPLGLPLRPGAPICTHFQHRGACKFGRTCKFDHPMSSLNYSPSASSFSDMPVAPYLVGYSPGTLAPSSSSSDLRPELIPGSTMVDTASTLASPLMSTSSARLGTIVSRAEPAIDLSKHSMNPPVISKSVEDQVSS